MSNSGKHGKQLTRSLALCIISAACAAEEQTRPPVATHALRGAAEAAAQSHTDRVAAVRQYVRHGWQLLRRSNINLLQAARDPKYPMHQGKWPVYVARSERVDEVMEHMRACLSLADLERLDLRRLPSNLSTFYTHPQTHGILYLPEPYVVPGGRFNEMYGWDSYFIQRGLLRDGYPSLAASMTENLLYQVKHYGVVLNANRSYFLTRSQPPFLSRMVLAAFSQRPDKRALRAAWPQLQCLYAYWTQGTHLTETGLSRYFDSGRGPAPEVVASEHDASGVGAYDRVLAYYRERSHDQPDTAAPWRRFYDPDRDALTEAFWVGDRAMRESGFDPSNRFGAFGAAVTDFNPVCLNSLLYVMEQDMARIATILGDPADAAVWHDRADQRARRVDALLWDAAAGLYLDYDVTRQERRSYPFVTTFYPLWAGMASPEQAARIVAQLPLFETPGGLQTSTQVTGNQWDAPYGWAPLQLIAVEGLRRYGFEEAANRISVNFLSMVTQEFFAHHGMFEKYDVVRRRSDVEGDLVFGYTSNELGFGWTNAVFAELYAALPAHLQQRVGDPRVWTP